MGKVEKELKGQMSTMAEQCDDALKNMRIKFMKEIDETLEERIPDINGRLDQNEWCFSYIHCISHFYPQAKMVANFFPS